MWPTMWLPHSHKIRSTTKHAGHKQNLIISKTRLGKGTRAGETVCKRNGWNHSHSTHFSRDPWRGVCVCGGWVVGCCKLSYAVFNRTHCLSVSFATAILYSINEIRWISIQYLLQLFGDETQREISWEGGREKAEKEHVCVCMFEAIYLCMHVSSVILWHGPAWCIANPPDPPTRD